MAFLAAARRRLRPIVCSFEPVLEHVPRGAAVFDIGCGTGFFLDLVARSRGPARLGGCEVSSSLLEHARATLAVHAGIPIDLVVSQGGVPDEVAGYEVVTMVDVLHHIPRDAQADFLTDLARRLPAGGRLVLKDIDADRPLLCAMNKLHDAIFGGGAGQEWGHGRAEAHLRDAGLTIVASGARRKLWYPHYWVVAQKAPAR